jgi:putative mRNA 3-end processing factor
MADDDLIVQSDSGLYCPAGDFYIDAWKPVKRNVVTHAHSDHARVGSERYLAAKEGSVILRQRLGKEICLDEVEYGEKVEMGGVTVSLHPAGHVRGSSQVRVERGGEVWVASGDYKRQADSTCTRFEVVRCNTFITECTFGLPIFRWKDPERVREDMNEWWRENVKIGRTSILLAYSLGKAQRVLAGLDGGIGPILLHGAVFAMTEAYRASGAELPAAEYATTENAKANRGKALVIAPPSAMNTTWARKFGPSSVGMASGWMRIRGFRRRRGADRGFVLSDHVDFPSLLRTIEETGAERVIATHGYTTALVRILEKRGLRASAIQTRFGGEEEEDAALEEAAVTEAEATEMAEPAGGDGDCPDFAEEG